MYVLITQYNDSEDFSPMEFNYIRNDRGAKRKFRNIRTARKYGEKEAKRTLRNSDETIQMVRMEIEDAWEIDNDMYTGAYDEKEFTA